MVSHDQKSNVAHHFVHPDLRNAVVPFWCCPYHKMLTSMQWHHMIPAPMPMASCDTNVNDHGIT